MRAKQRWGLVLALSVVALACGETGPDAEIRAKIAEGCAINSDCASPLVCVFATCHIECATQRDCAANGPKSLCVQGEKPYRVCQNEKEQTCVRHSECPGEQICGIDGHCRDACADDRDCGPAQRCVSTSCAEPTELIDGKLTPSKATGAIVSCARSSECPGALVCLEHACKEECLGDKDCGAGARCDATRCILTATNGQAGRAGAGGQATGGAGGQTAGASGNGSAGTPPQGGQGGSGASAGAAGSSSGGNAGAPQTAGSAGEVGKGGSDAGKSGTAGSSAGGGGSDAGQGGSDAGNGGTASGGGSDAGSGGTASGGAGFAGAAGDGGSEATGGTAAQGGSAPGGNGGSDLGGSGGASGSGPVGSCLCADPNDECDETGRCAQKGVTCTVIDDCGPTHRCSAAGHCVCNTEIEPTCGHVCDTQADCPLDYACDAITRRCKEPHRPLGCLLHATCPQGTVCLSEKCVPSAGLSVGDKCAVHEDCASGICSGVCLQSCWNENDCTKGHCTGIAGIEGIGSRQTKAARACIGDPPCAAACAASGFCRMTSPTSGDCAGAPCRTTADCSGGAYCRPEVLGNTTNRCEFGSASCTAAEFLPNNKCVLPTPCYLDDPATCPAGYTCSAAARFIGTVDQGACVRTN